MTTQVVILRAAGSFAPRFARLKNATKAFFNGLIASSVRLAGSPAILATSGHLVLADVWFSGK